MTRPPAVRCRFVSSVSRASEAVSSADVGSSRVAAPAVVTPAIARDDEAGGAAPADKISGRQRAEMIETDLGKCTPDACRRAVNRPMEISPERENFPRRSMPISIHPDGRNSGTARRASARGSPLAALLFQTSVGGDRQLLVATSTCPAPFGPVRIKAVPADTETRQIVDDQPATALDRHFAAGPDARQVPGNSAQDTVGKAENAGLACTRPSVAATRRRHSDLYRGTPTFASKYADST